MSFIKALKEDLKDVENSLGNNDKGTDASDD